MSMGKNLGKVAIPILAESSVKSGVLCQGVGDLKKEGAVLVVVWVGSGDYLWLPQVQCQGWESMFCGTGRRIIHLPAGLVEGLCGQFYFLLWEVRLGLFSLQLAVPSYCSV